MERERNTAAAARPAVAAAVDESRGEHTKARELLLREGFKPALADELLGLLLERGQNPLQAIDDLLANHRWYVEHDRATGTRYGYLQSGIRRAYVLLPQLARHRQRTSAAPRPGTPLSSEEARRRHAEKERTEKERLEAENEGRRERRRRHYLQLTPAAIDVLKARLWQAHPELRQRLADAHPADNAQLAAWLAPFWEKPQ